MSLTLLLANRNEAPVASDSAIATTETRPPYEGMVVAVDEDGDRLTYSLVSGPSHGSLDFNERGGFRYAPAANFVGQDAFQWKANDGEADSGIATVTITVAAAPDPPKTQPSYFRDWSGRAWTGIEVDGAVALRDRLRWGASPFRSREDDE